jgi:hypothetical protein
MGKREAAQPAALRQRAEETLARMASVARGWIEAACGIGYPRPAIVEPGKRLEMK